ncbi:hypothetical protein E2C01_068290 [Portunus trituberculatus]|uniref:Uncharacterized protein n=1 Tax=Portunus trituberculatus TaxID=210409 RepID=A0A5B7HXH7_PORTR|nr:hypothetical protein [Portunus trituberculatus]
MRFGCCVIKSVNSLAGPRPRPKSALCVAVRLSRKNGECCWLTGKQQLAGLAYL